MKEQKMVSSRHDLKKKANKIIEKAKQRNLVKPLSEAFKDVPAAKEIHKGKTE